MAEGWIKLADCIDEAIYIGTIFRFPAREPYETIVDYMLMWDESEIGPQLKFVVTTGYKAGLVNILSRFPEEARIPDSGAISAEWLFENWLEWVYPDTDPSQIYVLENYPAPESLPG